MDGLAGRKPGKNQTVEIEITDLGTDGEGIGRYEGFTLFVKGALPGELVRAQVLKVNRNYGYAKPVEYLRVSKDRVTPRCPLAGRCGGCQLQHLKYEKQLEYKQKKIEDCLKRIGGLESMPMEPIIGMAEPWHYRNKAQFPVGRGKDGRLAIGFYAGRTHAIMDTDHCYIQAETNDEVIRIVRKFLTDYRISIYDEKTHTGLVRHILTRTGFRSGEIMVCLVINGERLPYADRLVEMLRAGAPGVSSVCLNVNRERTNVILGDRVIPVYGEPYITDWIGEVRYQISPLSFYQVNPAQTQKLYETALEFADLKGGETVWDLYCGIGTISLFLAQKAGKVYGVEIVPQAIEDAKRNAKLNGIENAEFFVGASEEVLPQKYRELGEAVRADVVVVDPPRKGCDERLLRTIGEMGAPRVVYVSCDPGTLGRDVKVMRGMGYEVERVRGVDMFGGTGHVETVCLLSKLKSSQHIEIELDMDELDLIDAEKKATYHKIKDYVLEHSGLKVSSLYIAQVKQKCGIIERENYTKPKSENVKQPQYPPEKEKAIKEALKHFGMV